MEYIENKTFDEIKLGDFAELTHTLVSKIAHLDWRNSY